MIEEIKKYLDSFSGELSEDGGLFVFKYLAGERKTALNQKKVSYTTKFRIDESKKLVKFTEIISEVSSGLGVGDDMAPGIGFKKEQHKTSMEGREGTVTEKSTLAGETLGYKINYQEIRNTIKKIAEKNGYRFKYKIFPWGI